MSSTAAPVPAGWYADPLSSDAEGQATHRRWWDGVGWTHHVAPLDQAPARVSTVHSAPVSPDISPATMAFASLSSRFTLEARREAALIAETMHLHVSAR